MRMQNIPSKHAKDDTAILYRKWREDFDTAVKYEPEEGDKASRMQ